MQLLVSGRDADIYAYGDGLVLRRYRDGRSAEGEAATMRAVALRGYPMPAVHAVAGPDIVMEHVKGPTLAEAMLGGVSPASAGSMLADLHDRLHALDWLGPSVGESLLHLDLHPLNVIMRGSDPVVIDWANARAGPAGLDVALTALILAQVAVTDGTLAGVGVADDRLRMAMTEALQAFGRRVSTHYVDQLPAADAFRREDPNQSAAELQTLARAHELAASTTT